MTASPGVADLPLQRRLIGVRVGLIEDHTLLAQSLLLTLRSEGADVEVIEVPRRGGVAAVVEPCLRHRPHVVLLDLSLGEGAIDGDQLIAPLVRIGTKVVMLTGSTDAARLGGCLELGAIAVIAKAEPLDFLVEQVRRAAHGERVLTAQRRLDLLLEGRKERAEREQRLAPFESLTEREQQVLAELVHGHQVEEISHRMFVSAATVRTHVRAILQKLGVRSQLAAVARAREVGWED
jgi:DNA-binding NarL/FixJ family response regulator